MIWLAILVSAALTSVGLTFPDLTASNADAATLPCGAPLCGNTTPSDNTFTSSGTWAAVGARSTTASGDPRVCLYTDATYTTQRACSQFSTLPAAVEFVVADGHHTPSGTTYVRSDRVSGSGEVCSELDCGTTTLVPNAAATTQAWGAGDIVRVYNVPVANGQTYRADLVVTSGTTDFGLALFNSQGQAGYAAGRSQAVTSADLRGTGQGEGIYFKATATDTLGLVLWGNNAGTTANFRIEVRTATRLVSNTPLNAPGDNMRDYLVVPSAPRGWAVLALRPSATSDADLRQYDAPDYLGLVGKSNAVEGTVDFVITDYAHVSEDTSAVLEISLGPIGGYMMDWSEHPTSLLVNVNDTIALGGRVGLGRSVALTAGVEYGFLYDPTDGTTGDASLGLYGPTLAKPNFTYGTRADSLAGSDVFGVPAGGWAPGDGIEEFFYTPEVSGEFLLYAYQKTGASVLGNLRFFPTSLLGVGDGPAAGRLTLSAAWPSPARSGQGMHFRCSLPRAGAVQLSIVDVRGRVVATPFAGQLPEGPSDVAWDGRAGDGSTVRPGLYFARLTGAGGPGGVAGSDVRRVVWLR